MRKNGILNEQIKKMVARRYLQLLELTRVSSRSALKNNSLIEFLPVIIYIFINDM